MSALTRCFYGYIKSRFAFTDNTPAHEAQLVPMRKQALVVPANGDRASLVRPFKQQVVSFTKLSRYKAKHVAYTIAASVLAPSHVELPTQEVTKQHQHKPKRRTQNAARESCPKGEYEKSGAESAEFNDRHVMCSSTRSVALTLVSRQAGLTRGSMHVFRPGPRHYHAHKHSTYIPLTR